MKSKLTESQHIDICKPINLLNKKWGDKNPPQATQLWLKPHKKKQSSRESWKAKILSDTCKTMKKKKKKIVNTKRDANETVALVWTVTLNVWDKLERWQSIGKFGLKCQIAVLNDRTRKSCALGGQFTYAKKTVKRDKKHRRKRRTLQCRRVRKSKRANQLLQYGPCNWPTNVRRLLTAQSCQQLVN